jgi:hypothetical protein
MTAVDPAYAEYASSVFDYEEEAYKAAESGDYASAADTWQQVLDSDDMRACFSDEAVKEIAFNLAIAYHELAAERNDASYLEWCRRIIDEWLQDVDTSIFDEDKEASV